jgi:four helix bundle protein
MYIALKESRETEYRLKLLRDSWYLENYEWQEYLFNGINKIITVLTKIIKTSKLSLQK